jgi:hypothetical protein
MHHEASPDPTISPSGDSQDPKAKHAHQPGPACSTANLALLEPHHSSQPNGGDPKSPGLATATPRFRGTSERRLMPMGPSAWEPSPTIESLVLDDGTDAGARGREASVV